ncbi:c-type cytochrome domain-containing protein [Haloferula sp. BvORR071]|uniref:c-type cytochrome domain-containing protein n=1 Tax=Haloferula sp. BvORR071 TaxID=1396141 RepID=UPI000553846B|nr:c-type cytochrome domain-containing protein [Haloferula sp. BvORR071]
MSPAATRLLGLLAVIPLSLTLAHAQEAKGGKDKDKEWDVSKLDATKLPAAAKKEGLTFEKDIQPLLKESCVNCHGEKKQKGDLRLDSLEAALKGGEHGKAVVPGEAAKSSILFAAAQVNDDIAMPPKKGGRGGGPGGPGGPGGGGDQGGQQGRGGPRAKPLTNDQVGILRAWIEQGAK